MRGSTLQRVASPTAILVDLPDGVAARCTALLSGSGLRVLRVGHVAAACERIPVVMPQLVLVSPALDDLDREMLADRCVAVGADVLVITPELAEATLASELRQAASAALLRALRA